MRLILVRRMTRRRLVYVTGLIVLVFLMSLLALRYRGGADYDRNTAARADLTAIETQLNVYKKQNGSYPTTEQGLRALVVQPTSSPVPQDWVQLFRELPVDPWQHAYIYRFPSAKDANTFDLFSLGPDGVESSDDIWLPR